MINNQRGIALVITLLVIVLLTITVIEFTYSVQVDQHMAHNALSGLQASLLARSGINLGEAFLLHDNPQDQYDAFTEDWCPEHSPDGRACLIDETNGQVLLPQNMRLRVQIIDEQGKLNLNSVRFNSGPAGQTEWQKWRQWREQGQQQNAVPNTTASWRQALERLLEGSGVDTDQVFEYFDRAFEMGSSGAGGPLQGTPPQSTPPPTGSVGAGPTPDPLSALQDFASLDDASVIPSLTPSVIRRLRPVLTAVPRQQQQAWRINANTAPPEVLQAVFGSEDFVEPILSMRREAPIRNLTPILAAAGKNGATLGRAAQLIGFQSSYFLVRASGVVNPNPVTGRGGIGRSATMLVRRARRTTPGNVGSAVPWTLTQLDWQKEGGAILFQSQGDQQPGTDDQQAVPRASR